MYLASPLLTVMTSADEQQPALLDSYLQSRVGDEASVGGTHGVMGDAASTHKEVPLAGADVVDGGSSTSGERSGAWCLLSPGCHSLPACAAFRSLSTSGRKAAVKTQGRCSQCLKRDHLARECRACAALWRREPSSPPLQVAS